PDVEGEGHSELKLFDLSGRLVRTLDRSGPGVLTPVFSPDGKLLAVGNRNHETQLFDVATGKMLHLLPKRMTQELAFSPDGKVLAAGYVDGTVALWDVASGALLRSQASGGAEVYTLDWSPAGDVLVTAGRYKSLGGEPVRRITRVIELWNPQTLDELNGLEAPDWVIRARFTSDGTHLVTSGGSNSERKVVVWAIRDGAD